MMHRAYSLLEIKAVKDDQRIILGTATTPAPDRIGDIVEPLGVTFKNPLPLLWQHHSDQPVGTVRFQKPTKDGVDFEARLPVIDEPGPLKDRVDTAWGEIKHKLVRGVSIGFKPIEFSFMDDGGVRFQETEVLELSLVTIPANAEATIQTVKSIDATLLAASGHGQQRSDQSSARAGARTSTPIVKARKMKRTIAEQISAFEATRAAKAAELSALQEKSADEGVTKDAASKEVFDTLFGEIKALDSEIIDLRNLEKLNIVKAVAVKGDDADAASTSRGASVPVVSVKANVPPGTAFIRKVWCRVNGYLTQRNPADVAKAQSWHDQMPEIERVLRTAVAAGTTTDTTWASPLVEDQNLVSEYAEILRAGSIIGRIPGLTRVPFNVKIPRETTAASVNWIGEGKVKPVSAMAFDQITLAFHKIAGIVPVTEELFRFSSPAIEGIIRNSLTGSIIALMDRDFLDPTKAATDVSPASVTNGVTPITATGTNADALRADLGTLLAEYTEANLSLATLVLIMTASQAMKIALMRNTLGQREFEGLGRDGGSLEGIPVVVSENMVATGGSPADGGLIIAMNARDVLLADDGGVNIDVSREATLQMETTPDSPAVAGTVLVSLWQHNMIALKAERFITWKKRRTEAVQFIQNAKYA